MIFVSTASSLMPLYGVILLFETTASGFAMNARSVTSFQVIPELLDPESSWRNLVPYPPLRQRPCKETGRAGCHPPLSSDRFGNGC